MFDGFCKMSDVIKLGWLPIKESGEYNLDKLSFNSIHNYAFPEYLKLNVKEHKTNLCKCQDVGTTIQHDNITNSYSFRVASAFNALPKNIKLK